MGTLVALLRAVNLGSHNRVRMPELRAALEAAGFEDVRTYLQSGNAVLRSPLPAAEAGAEIERVLREDLGVGTDVLMRTAAQLAEVVRGNPFGEVEDGKKLHVAFLDGEPSLPEGDFAPEAFVLRGRELYVSLPNGMRDSPLMKRLGRPTPGVRATFRNWNTVLALHELAGD